MVVPAKSKGAERSVENAAPSRLKLIWLTPVSPEIPAKTYALAPAVIAAPASGRGLVLDAESDTERVRLPAGALTVIATVAGVD